MINLLPTDRKAEIRAARTNVALVRYITILMLALAFILGAMYVTYTVLDLTKSSSDEVIASNSIKEGVGSSQTNAANSTLSQAKELLNQENRYSKVFTNIARLMPPGTIFSKLDFSDASFTGTPTTTKIYAKTTTDITTLRQNFEVSPMFSNVSFQAPNEKGGIEGYPVSVDVSFSLTKVAAL